MIFTNSRFEPRRLPVQWLDHSWMIDIARPSESLFPGLHTRAGRLDATGLLRRSGLPGRKRGCPPPSGFTVLEMLVVVTIIGFLAALAMPHLVGITQSNSMTAATQQLSAAVSLARQTAISTRSTVYIVFDTPSAYTGIPPQTGLNTYNTLALHQYAAYALVSPRSVGDQPGRPNPQYLTEWKILPDGVFFPTSMFTGSSVPFNVLTTNTLAAQSHQNVVYPFTYASFPFPTASSTTVSLPCIGFSSLGQLLVPNDQYIPLARGAVRYLPGNVVNAIESPSGNSTNNCNMIDIDYFTARPKLVRNSF
jgi:prepilin-type N-terminal cleavage/methylation domain-containing protein